MAFKCDYCYVFVMCSFNTWMKLSAEYRSQSSSKFVVVVHSISEPIAERRTSYICTSRPDVGTCPHTNDQIPQAECCWEKTGK